MPDLCPAEKILVVEDDGTLRSALAEVLRAHEYEVAEACDGREALEAVRALSVDLVLTDLIMPVMGGKELLAAVRSGSPEIPVIVMTGCSCVRVAAELTRAGAAEYLAKPFSIDVLVECVRRALDATRAAREQSRARSRHAPYLEGLIGSSPPMMALFEQVGRVAGSPALALVTGETGVGKDVVVRAVHAASRRGPLVTVNCGAIPEHLMESELFGHKRGAFTGADRDKRGLFEAANKGTLFLDEIGELPLALQPKLLRVIETGELRPVGGVEAQRVDVRIIAATHRDLEAGTRAWTFREDLYWRIHVLHLRIPPLRERRSDIPHLVADFLSSLAEKRGVRKRITADATAALTGYSWPGNVRQLLAVLEQVVTFNDGPEIRLEHLPAALHMAGETRRIASSAAERHLSLAELEREYTLEVLRRADGNRTRAAAWLGVPRRTLYRRLEEYGVGPSRCEAEAA